MRLSSSREEEYPKGEVVGRKRYLFIGNLFTYHPVTACHPSSPEEGSCKTR